MRGEIYIGQLNRRIEIQKPVTSHSATGQEIITWTTMYCCWARVEFPAAGSDEGFIGDQQVATTRAEFAIRYRDGMGEKWRVLYKGQYYDILTIEEVGTNEYLILKTEKRI